MNARCEDKSTETINVRLPVWRVLSELFLDTELDDRDYQQIAKVCDASPYTVKELEHILFNEVWPVLHANLYSVAGNWSGWNDEFLISHLSIKGRPVFSISWRFHPAKRFFLKDGWAKILKKMTKKLYQ